MKMRRSFWEAEADGEASLLKEPHEVQMNKEEK
jgi:hypothetical protein